MGSSVFSVPQRFKTTREWASNRRAGLLARLSTLTNQRMLDANQRALISHRLATRGYLTLCASVSLCFPRPRKVAPSPGVLP